MLTRTIGAKAKQICFSIAPSSTDSDSFTVSGTTGAIRITATSPSAASEGAGWYLKYVVHADVNLGSFTPKVPAKLPAPPTPISQTSNASDRYVGNDTQDGYTDPNMGWSGWQQLLDMYALHGINEVYVLPGTDAVYERVLEDFGYTADQARAWIPQPAAQPWWVMQNMSNDSTPISQSLLDSRAALARKIVARCKELGITPVLPGYFGTVPTDFATANTQPDGTTPLVIPQGTWSASLTRPSWLAPTDPLFASVAADYYKHADSLLGTTTMYRMNPLQEGGKTGGLNVGVAANAIMTALQTSEPGATWMQLGWQSNPTTTELAGISDHTHLLITDGISDAKATFDRESSWPNTNYLFGSIYNYGGQTLMGGNGQIWLDRYFGQLARSGSHMTGVAIMPEGFQDPASFELLAEIPWHAKTFDLATWMQQYAYGRYGSNAAAAAWTTLAATAYSTPLPADGVHAETADSLYAMTPNLTGGSAYGVTTSQRYNTAQLATALPQLLGAASSVVQHSAYDFDLADLSQQVLNDQARVLLPQISAAYNAGDTSTFRSLTTSWLKSMELDEKIMSTVPWFRLGTYTATAAAAAGTRAESAVLQSDLLHLWTVWATDAGSVTDLNNYANHELAGLINGYYEPNWKAYFDSLATAMNSHSAPAPINWYARGEAFADAQTQFSARPTGDTVDAAHAIVNALHIGTLFVSAPSAWSDLAASPAAVSGSGTAGDGIKVTEGRSSVCTTVVSATGAWSCIPSTPLAQGRHVLTVAQTKGPKTHGDTSATTSVTFAIGTTLMDYWSMDATSHGKVADTAGGFDGALGGDASLAGGKAGDAAFFTGSATGTIATGAPDLSAPWSLGVWVDPTSTVKSMAIMNSGTSIIKLQGGASHNVGATWRNVADYTVPYTAPLNTWTYLTFVNDGTHITVYANGAVVGTINASFPLGRASIGSVGTDPTTGGVDELSVFSGALAAGQVATLYSANGIPNEIDAPLSVSSPADGTSVTVSPASISGIGGAGDHIAVTEGGTGVCTATVNAIGSWSCAPAQPLAQGRHVLTVTQSKAGADAGSVTVTFAVGVPLLVDYWSFDATSGGKVADTAGGYDGTVSGDAALAAGKVGNAAFFTGSTTGTITTGASDLSAAWSVGVWVDPTATTKSMGIMNSGTSVIKLQGGSAHDVGATRRTVADYTVPYVAPLNTWTYLTFVDDGTRITVYANGVVVGTINASFPLGRANIGSVGTDPTTGGVDELSVFSGALTGAQVATLYAANGVPTHDFG
ncbi:hypothetical protein GCM10027568_09570 [Humibacter soli]